MKKLSILLIAIIKTVSVDAQIFDVQKAKEQLFEQKIIVFDSLGKKINESIMITEIKIDKLANRLYHLRKTSDGRKDSTVCEFNTLKPIYFSSIGKNNKSIIKYDNNTLHAYSEVGGKEGIDKIVSFKQPIYDIFMDTYLVSLMNLKEGYKNIFYTYRTDLGRMAAFEVKDVKKDFLISDTNLPIPTYLVECTNENVELLCWYNRKTQDLLKVVIKVPNGNNWLRLTQNPKSSAENYEVFNRTLEIVQESEKNIIRLNENQGSGIAWLKDTYFTEGTIEFDARGRDILQKSFIGIAFHGINDTTYESVYFRPFNFQATDPIRKIHAVQYMFEPKFDFQTLRNTQKDSFEAPILPTNIRADEWFHTKVVVKNGRIKVFVNSYDTPCLDVSTLNTNNAGRKIGFWVGNNSNGDFANLKISD